jgi:hypothetical protein
MALLATSSPSLRCNFHDWKCDSEPSGSGVGDAGWRKLGIHAPCHNRTYQQRSAGTCTRAVSAILYVTVSTFGPCLGIGGAAPLLKIRRYL